MEVALMAAVRVVRFAASGEHMQAGTIEQRIGPGAPARTRTT